MKDFFTNDSTSSFGIKMFVLLFLVNIFVRLPLYFSDYFWFDGDEAIIGIMAQDVLETGRIPFFFYGQQYGFATLETLFSSFYILLLGSKVIALKLAGITLHSLAILFLSLTLRHRQVQPNAHIFLLILIVLFPPFYLWASQMRTTSFLLASILFYITETKSLHLKYFLLVFGISFLLLEAQAMFFLFALVFVGNWIWPSRHKWSYLFSFTIGLLIILVGIDSYNSTEQSVHSVQMLFGFIQIEQVLQQFRGIIPAFSGFHYFTSDVPLPGWYTLFPIVLICICLLWLFKWSLPFFKKEQRILIFFAATFFLFIFFLSVFKSYGPRYWINFFGGTLLLMVYFFIRSRQIVSVSRMSWIVLVLFLTPLFAAPNMRVHFYDVKISERKAFDSLNHEIRMSRRKAVFTTDVYLQWQWNYLNGKDIPCCSFNKQERTDKFLNKVKDQYKRNPESVGMIGFWGLFWEMDRIPGFYEKAHQVGEKYYWIKEIKPKYYQRGMEVANN